MSKGSTRRPAQISPEEEAKRWEEVFGKRKPEPDPRPRKRCPEKTYLPPAPGELWGTTPYTAP